MQLKQRLVNNVTLARRGLLPEDYRTGLSRLDLTDRVTLAFGAAGFIVGVALYRGMRARGWSQLTSALPISVALLAALELRAWTQDEFADDVADTPALTEHLPFWEPVRERILAQDGRKVAGAILRRINEPMSPLARAFGDTRERRLSEVARLTADAFLRNGGFRRWSDEGESELVREVAIATQAERIETLVGHFLEGNWWGDHQYRDEVLLLIDDEALLARFEQEGSDWPETGKYHRLFHSLEEDDQYQWNLLESLPDIIASLQSHPRTRAVLALLARYQGLVERMDPFIREQEHLATFMNFWREPFSQRVAGELDDHSWVEAVGRLRSTFACESVFDGKRRRRLNELGWEIGVFQGNEYFWRQSHAPVMSDLIQRSCVNGDPLTEQAKQFWVSLFIKMRWKPLLDPILEETDAAVWCRALNRRGPIDWHAADRIERAFSGVRSGLISWCAGAVECNPAEVEQSQLYPALNNGVVQLIAEYLESTDLINLSMTCRQLYHRSGQEIIWRRKVVQDFGYEGPFDRPAKHLYQTICEMGRLYRPAIWLLLPAADIHPRLRRYFHRKFHSYHCSSHRKRIPEPREFVDLCWQEIENPKNDPVVEEPLWTGQVYEWIGQIRPLQIERFVRAWMEDNIG